MFKLLTTLSLIIAINGCDTKLSNLRIPISGSIKAIYCYNIDMDDKYLGIMELKSGKENATIVTNDENTISELLSFIEKNESSWKKLPKGRTYPAPKLYAFLNQSNKAELVLWFSKNELTILTKPIDSRNVHWSYSLDNQSSTRLTKYLHQ